ncbi:uncharacterized protein LOC132299206 [Cornus florida]|uniref:uncharacterized protein LOC132299206 n=1 Tax=Cornus florida TaxID=4283 RepID=UPI00289CAF02|nr:uncharacterized protein LOC132299206 [Cornus florida]
MGSSSSRMERPSGSRLDCTKRRLSSLVCCGSTSHSSLEMEEYPAKSPVSSVENLARVSDEPSSSREESSVFGSETAFIGSKTDVGSSSESSDSSIEDNSAGNVLRNAEMSREEKRLLESKELVSHQLNACCSCNEACLKRNTDTASTSYEEQPYLEPVSTNAGVMSDAEAEADNSMNGSASLNCPDDLNSTNVAPERPDGGFVENSGYVVMGLNTSASGSLSVFSGSLLSLQLLGDDTARMATPPGSGFLVSDSEQDLRSGSVPQVDVVSISSNILSSRIAEISNLEARRNSRRLYWDALSRRSFRRYRDSPTIVFTTGHADDLGSHDRWLLDLSGDLHYDGVGRDSRYLGTRGHRRNERQWQSRSESSERLHSGLDEGGRRTDLCASGLHPDGTCFCESFFMAEESGTLASISRIVMLAEALSEVLDEIHPQSSSLPLSMLSLPAPESVVNSFPLKNHKKSDATESETNDVQQCYICLAEYDEGDKIRVLPCHHEYHMSCVDKWLKEIHRVCPLCRCNVCGDIAQGSVSSTEIPSE